MFQKIIIFITIYKMFVTPQQISNALGAFKSTQEKNYYSKIQKYFSVMKMPQPGDWLHGHKQKGQLFVDYREPIINFVTPERKIIYLQPFGKFNQKFLNNLVEFCQIFYPGMKVKIANQIDFDKLTVKFTKRENIFGDQYVCQDILEYMKKNVPKDAYCVMGITLKDLYPGPNWNFVYGWASYKHRVGIFSFIRWDQDYGYGNTDTMDWQKILYPSMRTMVHQIGHMFGIYHCIYYDCLMNGYNNIQQNYQNPLQFCPVCYKKIIANLKFDSQKRYTNLIKYCKASKIVEIQRQLKLYTSLLKIATQQPIKMIQNNVKKQVRGLTTQKIPSKPILNKQVIKKPVTTNIRSQSVNYNIKKR